MSRKKIVKVMFVSLFVGAIYPAFVLGFVGFHVIRMDLPGGRHGPLDAYRHTLASATVSYTLGGWAVELVTAVMESNSKRSSGMDRHNNRIGKTIGSNSESFDQILERVQASIRSGQENSPRSDQTTWLPEKDWRDGLLW